MVRLGTHIHASFFLLHLVLLEITNNLTVAVMRLISKRLIHWFIQPYHCFCFIDTKLYSVSPYFFFFWGGGILQIYNFFSYFSFATLGYDCSTCRNRLGSNTYNFFFPLTGNYIVNLISDAFFCAAPFEMPTSTCWTGLGSIRGWSVRRLLAMHTSMCRHAVEAGKL